MPRGKRKLLRFLWDLLLIIECNSIALMYDVYNSFHKDIIHNP